MTVLPSDRIAAWKARLRPSSPIPDTTPPLHVVYGGAHRFAPNIVDKLGLMARTAVDRFAPDPDALSRALAFAPEVPCELIYARVRARLETTPIEDFRIDFEDGYGTRSDDEEDRDASAVGEALAEGVRAKTLPPRIGLRIKGLHDETGGRGLRTLGHVFDALGETAVPDGFVVTLPKVTHRVEIEVAAEALAAVEQAKGWPSRRLRLEAMIEQPSVWFDDDGRFALPQLAQAADGRLVAVHLGPYDYTASIGVAAADQALFHPALDIARHWMQVAFAGSNVRLGDGPTTLMPIPPHRGPPEQLTETQRAENRDTVHRAWRHHAQAVRDSMRRGFDTGWDLHPAQIPARLGAVYAAYHAQLPSVAKRLRNFVAAAGQATRVGAVFDDAATGQGLVNFCLRALSTGAVTEEEVTQATGLDRAALATRSFREIVSASHSLDADRP